MGDRLPIEGAKKGGGHTAVEDKDSLRSTQTAQVLDLWCEGEIEGLVNGLKSLYLDGVPVQNADGTYNFQNVQFAWKPGTQGQSALPGLDGVSTELAVGVVVTASTPVVRTISNPGVDMVVVTIAVPALTNLDTGSGDLHGSEFTYTIEIQSAGGGFVEVVRDTVKAKTTSTYKRAKKIQLSGMAPWDVRVKRISADSTTSNITNAFSWDSYTEVQTLKLRYPNSALGFLQVSAQQFNRIPTRAADIKALIVPVPTNYDPMTRTYSGTWDGTFKMAWTDNPVWQFREVALNKRWGCGNFIQASQLNKWKLYQISQYCDEMVSNGRGGVEPRFSCGLYLQTREQARKVLQDLAAVFRAMAFWAGGELQVVQDAPSSMVHVFNQANIAADSYFEYQTQSDLKRHSVFIVSYNDITQMGKRVPEVYAPDDLVAKYGVVELELSPIGVWSRSQAQRLARWAAYSEAMEDEVVQFHVGAEGAAVVPGQVFGVTDPNEAGERRGGRLHAAATAQVTLDAAVTLNAGESYTVIVQLADPADPAKFITQERAVTTGPSTTAVLDVSPAFSSAPLPESPWILSSDQLVPTTWRCLGVTPVKGKDQFEITGVAHDPGKFALIEQGIAIVARPISRIAVVPPAVQGPLAITETQYLVGTSYRSRVTVSWTEPARGLLYAPSWRVNSGTWVDMPATSANCFDIDAVPTGVLEVSVRSQNALGMSSPATSGSKSINGKSVAVGAIANQDTFTHFNKNEVYIHGLTFIGDPMDAPGAIMLGGVVTPVPNGLLASSQGPQRGWIMWDSAGATFAMNALPNAPYAFVRKSGGSWQYDNDAAWVTFTPGSTHWVIGTMQSADADAVAGSGITQVSMWADATAPALVDLGDTAQWDSLDVPGNILPNLVDASWWAPGAPFQWNLNQTDAGENAIVWGAGPKGNVTALWKCVAAGIAGAGADGGWNPGALASTPSNAFAVDTSKTYRFALPVRRESGTGNAYWGPPAGMVCDLNTATPNGNPYFWSGGLTAGRWYLVVGYVYPAGATGLTHDGSGLYDMATGALISPGLNFNWLAGLAEASTRAYQYYASTGAVQYFDRPLVHIVDGSEPSLKELLQSSALLNSQQQWSDVNNRPVIYRVVSRGANDTAAPVFPGLYDEAGNTLAGAARSYAMARVRRSDGALVFSQVYDVYGAGATQAGRDAAALAADLNASGTDVIVIVWTYDEPKTSRLSGGLETAMYRCGASRSVFGSVAGFRYRGSYILVGIPGCGEGAGAELYNGDADASTNAWCDMLVMVKNGGFTASSSSTPRTLVDYGYVGELDATKGANWETNLANIPYATVYTNDDSNALGFNPTFSDWPDGQTLPTGWIDWVNGALAIRETSLVRVGRYALKFDTGVPANVNVGAYRDVYWNDTPMAAGTFIAGSIDFRIVSRGAGDRPGMLVRLFTNVALNAYVDTYVQPPSTATGAWQRAAFSARVGAGQQIYGMVIYLMATWTGFPGGTFQGVTIFDNLRFAFFDNSTDNKSVTIGANGLLNGGGGGQVTITGLGYTGDLNATHGAQFGVDISGQAGTNDVADGAISESLKLTSAQYYYSNVI